MVKYWQFLLELNFKRLYRSSGKEKGSRCLVFTSSTKREIRHFHVVVVQWRQRNVQKSVMHEQSCCLANLNPLFFCRSPWRRRRRCLSLFSYREALGTRLRKCVNLSNLVLCKYPTRDRFFYLQSSLWTGSLVPFVLVEKNFGGGATKISPELALVSMF